MHDSQRDTDPKRVLVLGDDTRIVLSAARSLGRHGLLVDVAWCGDYCPAVRSRYIQHIHSIAWPSSQTTTWRDELRSLLQEQHYDLVMPVTESAVHALQTHHDDFADVDNIYFVPEHAYGVASSKHHTYQLAEQLDIPYPATHAVEDEADLLRLLPQLQFPLIVKPCSSVDDSESLNKHFVQQVDSSEELTHCWQQLQARGATVLLQQYVAGIGVGVEILAHEGKIQTVFQHQRIHETSGHGSSYRMAVELSPELVHAAEKLIDSLNYTGVAMVEFRVDQQSGSWNLIEINPRFWGSLPLAVASGADFPFYLYQQLVEGETSFPSGFPAGRRSRMLTYDLMWFASRILRADKSHDSKSDRWVGWNTNSVPWSTCLAHALRGLGGLDSSDTFAWDDPRPAFEEIAKLFNGAVGRLTGLITNRFQKSFCHLELTKGLLPGQNVSPTNRR